MIEVANLVDHTIPKWCEQRDSQHI